MLTVVPWVLYSTQNRVLQGTTGIRSRRNEQVKAYILYIHTNGLAGYGFEKSREDKARQGKQEERRPEKTRKTKNGKGFAVFFAVE